MRRRSFLKSLGCAVAGVLAAVEPVEDGFSDPFYAPFVVTKARDLGMTNIRMDWWRVVQ